MSFEDEVSRLASELRAAEARRVAEAEANAKRADAPMPEWVLSFGKVLQQANFSVVDLFELVEQDEIQTTEGARYREVVYRRVTSGWVVSEDWSQDEYVGTNLFATDGRTFVKETRYESDTSDSFYVGGGRYSMGYSGQQTVRGLPEEGGFILGSNRHVNLDRGSALRSAARLRNGYEPTVSANGLIHFDKL